MANANRRRGFDFERQLVNEARRAGLAAERAWGSNGEAIGEAHTVDCRIADLRTQAKRRKKLASFLRVPDGCDAVAFRQDRGDVMVLLSYPRLLALIAKTDVGNSVGP